MQPSAEMIAIRQVVLAVSVLDDVDVTPSDRGFELQGEPNILVTWDELRAAIGRAIPAGEIARIRMANWLRARRITAARTAEELRPLARPVALPVGHALHPGPGWARSRLHGGALELGLGFVGVTSDPEAVMVIPPGALRAAHINVAPWWPDALDYLERMGSLAADRLKRSKVLRPIGDCDVVTLLAARSLRAALCEADPSGMAAAAVPVRTRGWLDLTHIDPAFTASAAAATDHINRGFPRPVLLTVDEVALAPAGGRPAEIVLRDPALASQHYRAGMAGSL